MVHRSTRETWEDVKWVSSNTLQVCGVWRNGIRRALARECESMYYTTVDEASPLWTASVNLQLLQTSSSGYETFMNGEMQNEQDAGVDKVPTTRTIQMISERRPCYDMQMLTNSCPIPSKRLTMLAGF